MERIFNNVKITSSFEKSETRENLVSGETIGQHFGKIAKVIDDLENGEFNCNLTIDNALSETSENPVQNKVINAALKSKADQTTVDNALAQKANLEYVNASLTGKSDTGHIHDDRYYTETEINTKLNTKLNTSLKGAANGLAELDSSGKVPSAQLPSYVDDVLEYANQSSFPAKGESGKIYIAQDTNKTYRWSGSTYVEISPSLALGETSSTAYRGDRGKVAYDHSQTAHAPSNAQANVIETIKVNGTALTPTNKAVNITVPTVGNGTITIKQAGTTKGTFTTNQSGNTTIELADNNTWRDVVDNLTSTDATKSLSANQGKVLKGLVDGKAAASHTHSAYVNQNAFSNITVGSTTITADTVTDTLTLVGSNVTLTPDATNDKVTIGITKANVTSALGYTPSTVKSVTVTLTTSGWNSNSQTVSASIVSANNIVIVSPVPEDQDTYSKCGIKCSAQSNGSLTFTCKTLPTTDIHINVVAF